MTRNFLSAFAASAAALFLFAASAGAQVAPAAKSASPFSYDIASETTLKATVSEVLTAPTQGMAMGQHLLLQTSSGVVDASLGRWATKGFGALSVDKGQQVTVSGIMKNFAGKQIFLVRTVTVNSRVYTIRNEHGFPLSSHARQRLSEGAAQKGGLL